MVRDFSDWIRLVFLRMRVSLPHQLQTPSTPGPGLSLLRRGWVDAAVPPREGVGTWVELVAEAQ